MHISITVLREIDKIKRVQVIGTRKYQRFIELHNFSGADWGEKFVWITKKSLADAYIALDEDGPAIDCFQNLGTALIPITVHLWGVTQKIDNLGSFVCLVYCKSRPRNLPESQWEMFSSRNFEGESTTILPHIMRAYYIALREKSDTSNCPVLPPLTKMDDWYRDLYISR